MSDSNLDNVSLLLPLTNNFKDHSSKLNPVTVVGNISISSTQSKWGGSSAYFDGSGDALTIPQNSNFNLLSDNWVIEGWYCPTNYSAANNVIFYLGSASNNKIVLATIGTNGYLYYLLNGSVAIATTSTVSLNTWGFFTLANNSGTTTLYLNGTSIGTTATLPTAGNKDLHLGTDNGGASYSGYIQDFRITKGVARYTANFTSPTEQFYFNPFHVVSLLLPFTGDNFSTKYNDCSLNTRPVSVYGNTKIKTDQSKWGDGSAYFDGSGDYLTIPFSQDFVFGQSLFTIECWVYADSWLSWGRPFSGGESSALLCDPGTYWAFGPDSSGKLNWYVWTGVVNKYVSTTSLSTGVWHHISLCRTPLSYLMFIDGLLVNTFNNPVNVAGSGSQAICIGADPPQGRFIIGYLQDLRITKGVARYSANFIVPSEPFYYPFKKDISFNLVSLLLPLNGANDSTTFVDHSSVTKTVTTYGNAKASNTQSKWGDGSAYFDGTGDYLAITKNNSFIMESSNFTIELWFNTTQSGRAYATLLSRGGGGFNAGSWTIMATGVTSGFPTVYWADYSGGAPLMVSSSGGYNDGNWHHLAWVRNGNKHSLYLDGISKASITTAVAMPDCGTNALILGTDIVWGGRDYLGYIQDVRITKGFARYASDFDIPIEPFYYNSMSALLLHFDGENNSTAITDTSYSPKTITPKSGAKLSTSQSKFGGSSLLLNGSTDYLELITNDFNFGTGPFTIECFVYMTALNAYHCFIDTRPSASFSNFIMGLWNVSGVLIPDFVVSNGRLTATTTSVPLNTWTHVAFTRNSSGIISCFVNGIKDATTYNYPGVLNASVATARLGSVIDPNYFSGYIDEFRIVKDKAIYNSNFFTPTTYFENDLKITFNYSLLTDFFQCNPGKISGAAVGFIKDPKIFTRDFEDGGNYFIEGVVTIDTVPSFRKVRLHTLNNGRLIKEVWSDPITGIYRFDNLKDQPYYIWSEDYARIYNPVSHLVTNTLNL